jgi:hypothetical protein
MKNKFNPSSVISSNLGTIKPEMPESVKVMMTQKMEQPSSKSIKLSVKKKKGKSK